MLIQTIFEAINRVTLRTCFGKLFQSETILLEKDFANVSFTILDKDFANVSFKIIHVQFE